MNWSWKLSEPVSTFGGDIDSIYYLILFITGIVFVLVELALIVFIFKYRRREGRQATYTHGSKMAEVIWTAVPFVLVLFIAYSSNSVWLKVKLADRGLENTAEVVPLRIAAKQFEWNVTYPGPDGALDTDDDFVKRNQLHIPVDNQVRVELTSDDVIHSFFLPDFRVKQDAVPGMMIPVWFEATKTGEYPLGCAELCGLGHYRMKGTVTVHPQDAFDSWQVEESGGGVASAEEPSDAPPAAASTESTDEETTEGKERA